MTCRWKKQRSIFYEIAFFLWEMAGKEYYRKMERRCEEKCRKTKDFCVDENGWIHCPFCKMQNADKDTSRYFTKELSNILSQMQTGMFDRC